MNDLRRRFMAEAVSTAGPATLLVMLMDRLVLDLDRADQALTTEDRPGASEHLTHAQRIVDALRANLDMGAWDGSTQLAAVYDYVFSLLVTANVRGDRAVLHEARDLIVPLQTSWTEAAATSEASAALAGGTAPTAPAYAKSAAVTGSSGGLLGVG